MTTFRVVRKSTKTGRVLKVLATFDNFPDAELFRTGFGHDPSHATTIATERKAG